jgi:hypothetical protein
VPEVNEEIKDETKLEKFVREYLCGEIVLDDVMMLVITKFL